VAESPHVPARRAGVPVGRRGADPPVCPAVLPFRPRGALGSSHLLGGPRGRGFADRVPAPASPPAALADALPLGSEGHLVAYAQGVGRVFRSALRVGTPLSPTSPPLRQGVPPRDAAAAPSSPVV